MALGWSEDGALFDRSSSPRIICYGPLGPPPLGTCLTPGVLMVPNVFTGLWPSTADPPAIAVGVADFSIEVWHCARFGSHDLVNNYTTMIGLGYYPGAGADQNWPAGVFEFSLGFAPPQAVVRLVYDDVIGGATIQTAWTLCPQGWHHLAGVFDRAGNMTLYIDGVASGAAAINANNIGSPQVYALTPRVLGDTAVQRTRCDSEVPGHHFAPVSVVGPFAFHLGLLTAAQIENSFRGKRVQNLAMTRACWYWQRIEGVDAWETDLNMILWKVWQLALPRAGGDPADYSVALPVAAPRGTPGTVFVPDLSGNNNHFVLPTSVCYGTDAGTTKALVGFMTDPGISP